MCNSLQSQDYSQQLNAIGNNDILERWLWWYCMIYESEECVHHSLYMPSVTIIQTLYISCYCCSIWPFSMNIIYILISPMWYIVLPVNKEVESSSSKMFTQNKNFYSRKISKTYYILRHIYLQEISLCIIFCTPSLHSTFNCYFSKCFFSGFKWSTRIW
jgi:hypothetical protein